MIEFSRCHQQRGLVGRVSIVGSECDGWSKRTVDDALGVADDLLDLALLLKIGERTTGKRAVDLQSVDKGGDGDEAVGLNLLLETVRSGLVEDDGVLGLVLDCVRIMSAKSVPLCGSMARCSECADSRCVIWKVRRFEMR